LVVLEGSSGRTVRPETGKGTTMAVILGDNADNIMTGTRFADVIIGFGGNDEIRGRGGSDLIYGGRGSDDLRGNAGHDLIVGGSGNDDIVGDEGNDILLGGADNDTLQAGLGNDALYGGAGNDTLDGGGGNDLLWGGPGLDVFEFAPNNNGIDIIKDWAEGDQLDVSAFGFTLSEVLATGQQLATNVLFQFDADTTVIVAGADLATFNDADFIL
jgi:Ca2+-binding RTX toxin-like protein